MSDATDEAVALVRHDVDYGISYEQPMGWVKVRHGVRQRVPVGEGRVGICIGDGYDTGTEWFTLDEARQIRDTLTGVIDGLARLDSPGEDHRG